MEVPLLVPFLQSLSLFSAPNHQNWEESIRPLIITQNKPYIYIACAVEKLKQEFMKEFEAQNFEREKAGLKPKDLCTALKRRNMDWWEDDPVCNPKK